MEQPNFEIKKKPDLKHYSSKEEFEKEQPIVGQEFSISVDDIQKGLLTEKPYYKDGDGKEKHFGESIDQTFASFLNAIGLKGENVSFKITPTSKDYIRSCEIIPLNEDGEYVEFKKGMNAKFLLDIKEDPEIKPEFDGDRAMMLNVTLPTGKIIKIKQRTLLTLGDMNDIINNINRWDKVSPDAYNV